MKQSTKKIKTLNLKFSDIKILYFSINNEPDHWKYKKDHQFSFELTVNFFQNPTLSHLGSDLTTNIYSDVEKSKLLCTLTSRMIFEVKDFDKLVIKKKTNYNIPLDIIRNIVSSNVSFSRGVLYTKTQGTFLQNVYLPPMDIKQLIK
ncbi:MAG: hypothetical protein IH819_12135 [Bacteroidetes bacterium]|nr:hypothetical protein [Bacteroidota bacterium]